VPDFEITTDEETVWVNSAEGWCAARFSRLGVDIHTAPDKEKLTQSCLYCTQTKTEPADWKIFQRKMLEHYKVEVPDDFAPGYLVHPAYGSAPFPLWFVALEAFVAEMQLNLVQPGRAVAILGHDLGLGVDEISKVGEASRRAAKKAGFEVAPIRSYFLALLIAGARKMGAQPETTADYDKMRVLFDALVVEVNSLKLNQEGEWCNGCSRCHHPAIKPYQHQAAHAHAAQEVVIAAMQQAQEDAPRAEDDFSPVDKKDVH
jgi:hypothetical protein